MSEKNSLTFEVNDYIVHGSSGVCVVEDIGPMRPPRQNDPHRRYYRLSPLYENNSIVYAPVDSIPPTTRKVLSTKEAKHLIGSIPDIETIDAETDKQREEKIREALRTNDCYSWVQVIKTLYLHTQVRLSEGKKASQTDEKYLRIAEDKLYGELAVPLDIPKDDVQQYINQEMQRLVLEKASS